MNEAEFIKLVDRFGLAAAKSAISNSGLCIDIAAEAEFELMKKLRKQLHELGSVFNESLKEPHDD